MSFILVENLNDSGPGSLRQAILDANSNGQADTIQFQAGLTGTLALLSALQALTTEIIINGDTNGDGKADVTISGNNNSRIFLVGSGGTVTLRSLTLTDGDGNGGVGGAIAVLGGGTLSLIDSTISDSNATDGGAIDTGGTLNVVNSTLSGNSASGLGGAVSITAFSSATFVNTTIDGNSANSGGALFVGSFANVAVLNSTIVGNGSTAGSTVGLSGGGGIKLAGAATLTINNSVVAGNTGPGSQIDEGTDNTVNVQNSFIGSVENIDGNTNNLIGTGDPLLGALADNGGTVQTRAPQAGSPLISAGNAALLPADSADLDGDIKTAEALPQDATGAARVLGTLDIGAVEAQLSRVVTTALDVVNANDGLLSLREAIALANNTSGTTITFAAGIDTIRLVNVLTLSSDVTIDGDRDNNGTPDVTISGDTDNDGIGETSLFRVETGVTATLDGLVMTKGFAQGSSVAPVGGAIHNEGTLTVSNSTLSSNNASGFDATAPGTAGGDAVGAILNTGTLTLQNTLFQNNSAFGGSGAGGNDGGLVLPGNPGLTGGLGGNGAAGVSDIWSSLGPVELLGGVRFDGGTAIGGDGGDGGSGGDANGATGGTGGKGGKGGFAATLFMAQGSNEGTAIIVSPTKITGGVGGAGGSAGTGSPNGVSGADGANGAADVASFIGVGADIVTAFTVTTLLDVVDTDDGLLSLREAIALANETDGASTIGFASALSGGTITLNGADLDITDDVTINGDTNGDRKADMTISGAGNSRIFDVDGTGTDVVLRSLTLTDGFATDSFGGGAIVASAGTSLAVVDSTLSGNNGFGGGGAITASGATKIVNSTLHGNVANFGGAIFAPGGGSLTLINSTVHDNEAGADGGGISTDGGTVVDIFNSTITGNRAAGVGGGIDVFDGSTLNITNSVVAGNTAPTSADVGSADDSGTVDAVNSFFGTSVNLAGTFTATQDGAGNPLLGALQDNGGPVLTRTPLAGSPLIDAGNLALSPLDEFDLNNNGVTNDPLPSDATGNEFFVGAALDIGAVEFAPPVIVSNGGNATAAISIAENATAVTTVAASDPTFQAITFSISGGADAAKFAINATTGALTFKSAPNREAPTDAGGNNVYNLTVRATDASGLTDDQAVAVTVTNVNEAPTITFNGGAAAAAVSVAENRLAVATITASDPDTGGSRSFSISGTDAALFAINATTGVLTFRSAPDFEKPADSDANNFYNLTVKVTDNGGLTDTQALTVRVTNVNEKPTDVKLSKAAVGENLKAGTVVGTLSIVDPDGPAATYKLTSNPGGFFKIVGKQLQTAKPLDFETLKSHAVTIEATDTGGLRIAKPFKIAVADVIDVITGTAKKNVLTGASGVDRISGLGGSDKLFGKGGKDTLDGGDGGDVLVGGSGADRLIGGKGADTASYEDAAAKIAANLKKPAKNKGDAAGDSYSSIENLTGSDFADTLTGNDGANTIRGAKGGDKITGGRGADTLSGNSGDDRFVFNTLADSTVKKAGRDIITDFSRGDLIDVSGIDAKAASKKSNQKFAFIGDDAFSSKAGELRFEAGGKKTFVYGDVTGDGVADFAIELAGKIALVKTDFVL